MTTSIRRARTVLLALTLGIVFAGLALAEKAPVCADRPAGKGCAARLSSAASQPGLNPMAPLAPVAPMALAVSGPVQSACFWAWYEEYYKDNEICRWYNSCTGERYGSCPDGYDWRYQEIFPCC
ncbi:MAG: hypothetical protein ACJ76J_03165 [Thermoanaerobaculia bacterium]